MKFGFIAKHRSVWPVARLCEALGVSRSGFRRAFARTISFRMTAVSATLAGLPASMSCLYFAFMSGLNRAATRAGM